MNREEILEMNEKAKKRNTLLGIIVANIVIVAVAIFCLVIAYVVDASFEGLTDDDLTRCKVSNVEQEFIEKKVTETGNKEMWESRKVSYVYDIHCNLTFTYNRQEKTYPYTFRKEISAANGANWKTDLYDGMEKDFFVVVDVKNDCLSSVREDQRESVPVFRMVFLILAGVIVLIGVIIDTVVFVKSRKR